jgi:BCL2-associated athanogene 1
MAKMQVRVKHNIATHDLAVEESTSLGELARRLAELTGVPVAGQRLILSGRQLNGAPGWLEQDVVEAGVKNGSKIMLLGKKYDPEQEAGYKAVKEVEHRSGAVEMKIAKIVNDIDGISKGHLAAKLEPEALTKLKKRCNLLNEEALKLLESLDAICLAEEQLEARVKRKAVVSRINKVMDETDRQLQAIAEMSSK